MGSPDGEVKLDVPILFQRTQRQSLRLIKASFSSQIANVYQLGAFNNGLLRVTNDGGASWTAIQLPNGVYTTKYIQGAITYTVAAWYTNMADPAIKIQYNLATQIVYVTLDSTKLVAPGQVGIDFSQSRISELLGFNNPANQTFTADGLHDADSYAKLDWSGNSVSVMLEGFGPLAIRNGASSHEFASVPLSASHSVNEYVYPIAGIIPPIIPIVNTVTEVKSFRVAFKGSRLDSANQQMPIFILEGNVELQFELRWTM